MRSFYLILTLNFFIGYSLAAPTPPFSGTVWVDEDIITSSDPSSFIKITHIPSDSRTMFDRRSNNGSGGWVTLNPTIFSAYYLDGNTIEIQVNPEFNLNEAAAKANFYGRAIGQLPMLLRIDVKTVWIHKGDEAFGGGNDNLLIHTEAAGYHGDVLEETLFHEACHTSLDSRVYGDSWSNAQTLDNQFISNYARDYPEREDVAESCALYYAVKFRPDRLSKSVANLVRETIPNRMVLFDSLGMKPVSKTDIPPSYQASARELILPVVKVQDKNYEVILRLTDPENLIFTLKSALETESANYVDTASYSDGLLSIPLLLINDDTFLIEFKLMETLDGAAGFQYITHASKNLGID
tara:strand:- start:1644 stop:2702 length:1059 start_codon:yes stop_codon:yes gene_type:complete